MSGREDLEHAAPPSIDDRRGDGRAPITLRVDYTRLNSFFADYTKNISKGGTFIRTNNPLDLGTEFVFVLVMPEDRTLELTGVVKWIVSEADATDDKPAGMGIQFVFADDAQRLRLDAFVADLMQQSLGPALAGKLLGTKD